MNQFTRVNSATKIKSELKTLIANSERGSKTTSKELKKINECFNALESLDMAGTRSSISGSWNLIWTTEKV